MLSVGDEVDVKLLEIDAKTGKMRLSMRALTEKPEGYKEPERRPRGGNDRGNGGNRGGNDRREGGRGNDRGERRGNDQRRDGGRDNRPRNDRPRHNNGPRNEAPAPSFDDFKESVDEVF